MTDYEKVQKLNGELAGYIFGLVFSNKDGIFQKDILSLCMANDFDKNESINTIDILHRLEYIDFINETRGEYGRPSIKWHPAPMIQVKCQ